MPTTTLRRGVVVAIAVLTLCGLAACSSDDSDSSDTTTTTTEATTTTAADGGESAATIKFDETIQQELADVGCHPGEVDGVIGPKTDEAIVAFQEAAGLEADGELGPETETALKDAVDKGTKVCDDATTTTTAGDSTTTTTGSTTTSGGGGGEAPCTATAILEGLPSEGESLSTYQCEGGYAAGILNDGTTRFILQSDDGKWVALSDDPCGSASAGIPSAILSEGCGS